MGTLYVASAPLGDLDDITLRALRKLREVTLVAAIDPPRARELLARLDISTPLVDAVNTGVLLTALEAEDVLLLADEELSNPFASKIVVLALEQGRPVIPIPGPTLPITALVISGLPADGFVYLGELSPQSGPGHSLLTSLARERRTIVAMATADRLPDHLADVLETLGDRALVIVPASGSGPDSVWRGMVSDAAAFANAVASTNAVGDPASTGIPRTGRCVLIIGGASKRAERWDEDVLRAEVRSCIDQGLSVKEVSQRLASESGWPRREVYRLAVEES